MIPLHLADGWVAPTCCSGTAASPATRSRSPPVRPRGVEDGACDGMSERGSTDGCGCGGGGSGGAPTAALDGGGAWVSERCGRCKAGEGLGLSSTGDGRHGAPAPPCWGNGPIQSATTAAQCPSASLERRPTVAIPASQRLTIGRDHIRQRWPTVDQQASSRKSKQYQQDLKDTGHWPPRGRGRRPASQPQPQSDDDEAFALTCVARLPSPAQWLAWCCSCQLAPYSSLEPRRLRYHSQVAAANRPPRHGRHPPICCTS
jgi:hypothetical protein